MTEVATPNLVHVTDLVAEVSPPIEIGPTPHGVRRIVPINGGKVAGPRINGRMLAGGADFQYWRSDGVTELHARYVIETHDGACIYVENSGLRHGPPEAMARLARGEPVDPAAIYFRTVGRLETSAADYLWTNRSIFLCAGARFPDRVVIRYFEVT
jgi:hypothetical protein